MDRGLRYFGGAVAFGFAAVWIMWSLDAALVCLLSAVAGYGAVFVGQRIATLAARPSNPGASRPRTTAPASRTPGRKDLSQRAAELNEDVGHVYEPTVTTHQPAQAEPPGDDTGIAGETPPRE